MQDPNTLDPEGTVGAAPASPPADIPSVPVQPAPSIVQDDGGTESEDAVTPSGATATDQAEPEPPVADEPVAAATAVDEPLADAPPAEEPPADEPPADAPSAEDGGDEQASSATDEPAPDDPASAAVPSDGGEAAATDEPVESGSTEVSEQTATTDTAESDTAEAGEAATTEEPAPAAVEAAEPEDAGAEETTEPEDAKPEETAGALAVAEPAQTTARQRGVWSDEQVEAFRAQLREGTANVVDKAATAVIETVNTIAAALRSRMSQRRGEGRRG